VKQFDNFGELVGQLPFHSIHYFLVQQAIKIVQPLLIAAVHR